jgi:hypothetical protein
MLIQLNDGDLAKMPRELYEDLLKWLQSVNSCSLTGVKDQPQDVHSAIHQEENGGMSHVRLSQLLDAGITKSGMQVRVRLMRKQAKAAGRDYLNGLTISSRGTVFHDGQEFDKPSPLAAKLNGGAANGWEYIEVKKDNDWIRLDNLRQQIR